MAERFYVQLGEHGRMYSIEADNATGAKLAVLARLGDVGTWPGECLAWNTDGYAALYGAPPAEVVAL